MHQCLRVARKGTGDHWSPVTIVKIAVLACLVLSIISASYFWRRELAKQRALWVAVGVLLVIPATANDLSELLELDYTISYISLGRFLSGSSDSPFIFTELRQAELDALNAQADDWEIARSQHTKLAYQQFLRRWPDGRYSAQAQDYVERFEQIESLQNLADALQNSFNQILII